MRVAEKVKKNLGKNTKKNFFFAIITDDRG